MYIPIVEFLGLGDYIQLHTYPLISNSALSEWKSKGYEMT